MVIERQPTYASVGFQTLRGEVKSPLSSGEFILAIDQGTTGTTCLLVDRSGVVRSRGYAPVSCAYPADGWVEQDARELWKSVLQAAAQALGSDKPALAAIGIANQRETTILWDSATGEPLAPP